MLSPIVIAGAGIGGLTAALSLAARGFRCTVLEKARSLEAVGAGIQLSPNASHILIGLGLGQALDQVASRPAAVVLNSVRAGRQIARIVLPQDEAAPYWVIHRADLQSILAQAVAKQPLIDLRLGAEVTDVHERTDDIGVSVGNETISAAFAVAADGVHSVLRQRLFTGSAPVPSGHSAWRGLTDPHSVPTLSDIMLWVAPRTHLIAYPLGRGDRTNLVVILPNDDGHDFERAGREFATQLGHAGWPSQACDLMSAARQFTRYPLLTAPEPVSWSAGRVALLGDAAHAMLPFVAQGAGMAIEDAAVLARCVDEHRTDLPAGLSRYATERRARVARVMHVARQQGRIDHLDGAMALARDMAIRLLGPKRLMSRQNWIYDWRV